MQSAHFFLFKILLLFYKDFNQLSNIQDIFFYCDYALTGFLIEEEFVEFLKECHGKTDGKGI